MTVVYDKQANLADTREIKLCIYKNPTALALVGYRTMVDPAIVSEKLNPGSHPAQIQIAEIDGNIIGSWAEEYGTGSDDAKVWHKASMPASGPTPILVYDRTPLGDDEDNEDDEHKVHVTDITGEKGHVMHLLFAGASTPDGYIANDAFWNGYFPVGAKEGLIANEDENYPTVSMVSCSSVGTANRETSLTPYVCPYPHTHGIGSISAAAANNVPPYKTLKTIRSNKILASIPKDAVIIFCDALPTGFTRYTAQDGYYIRGGSSVGATGGNSTRRFHVTGTSGGPSNTNQVGFNEEESDNELDHPHYHTFNAYSEYINNDPPYINVILGKADDNLAYIPAGAVIMFDDTPPDDDWEVLNWDGKLLKGAETFGGEGGEATRTPANLTANSGYSRLIKTASYNGGSTLYSANHRHSMTVGFGEVSTYPKCKQVIFAKAKHDITDNGPDACVIDQDITLNSGETVYSLSASQGRHVGVRANGDDLGDLVCCFTKSGGGTNDHIYIGVSSNGGKSWTLERVDTTDSNQMFSDLVVDKNNNVHIVWAEMMTSDADKRQIKYRKLLANGSWGSVETVSTAGNPYYQVDPCIQVKNDGVTIGVAWIGYGWGDNVAGLDVAYRERAEDGIWGSEEHVTTYATGALHHRGTALDFDTDDYPHIIANYGDQSVWNNSNIYYWYKTAAGWQAREQVNNDAADNNICPVNGNLVIDTDNNIHVVYSLSDATTPHTVCYKKKARGGAWPAKETVIEKSTTPDIRYAAPQLQLLQDGSMVCVYTGMNLTSDRYESAYSIRDPSTGWGSKTNLHASNNRNYIYVQMLWSRMPLSNGIFQSMSNQYMVTVYFTEPRGYNNIGDIHFEALPTTVIGDIIDDIVIVHSTSKRRGAICTSKINGPLASPALIS